MAKPEWGAKHQCGFCSKIFYDMQRKPIVCPGCEKTHVPVVILKPGRTVNKSAQKNIPIKPVAAEAAVSSDKPSGALLDDEAILTEEEPDVSDDDNVDGENLGVVVPASESES